MGNILAKIKASKVLEVAALYTQYNLPDLVQSTSITPRSFYQELAAARAAGMPFWIGEFKRKSPSEGWINQDADVATQVVAYAEAGARAISVLTDTAYFGGSYADLRAAAAALAAFGPDRPLLLQKDFVIDPVQIYLARASGADLILLIAAILEPDTLQALRETAESLGMGVLVEVHDMEELEKVQHLDFPVLGVNNRDLKTFRTSLNRVNVVAQEAKGRHIISESGIHSFLDFAVVQNAHGFLIGTGLMRQGAASLKKLQQSKLIFKACGIRMADMLKENTADLIGINFSPVSKRRMSLEVLDRTPLPDNAVAVFYQNTPAEIQDILARYPFRRVQLYAGDVSPAFVRSLRKKVLLAARIRTAADLEILDSYAADVDMFILDGPAPGSGTAIDAGLIPRNFPYPFLLAGGLHAGNIHLASEFKHCIGVDIASGIETNGVVDPAKVQEIAASSKKILTFAAQ